MSSNEVSKEDLSVLIDTSLKIIDEYQFHIKELSEDITKREEKYRSIIKKLNNRLNKYIRAVKSEQSKIENFRKIARNKDIELENKPVMIQVPSEVIEEVNVITGESIKLTQKEIDQLRSIS